MIRFAALLLFLAAPAFGQSVTLPETISAKANRPIFVSPTVDGDDLAWEVDAGLDDWVKLLPPDVAKNFGNSKIFYAEKGTYTVRAWTAKVVSGKAKLSAVAVCTIVVDGGGPPIPPVPVPPLPKPTDPLIDAVKFAWQMEFSPTKAQEAAGFATVYRTGMASKAATFGKLYEEIGAKVKELGLNGKLTNVQKAVNAELAKTLPNPTTQPNLTIDAASLVIINREFGRAVAAWESLK